MAGKWSLLTWPRRGWYWWLDYWYVSAQQLRGLFARVPRRFAEGSERPVLLLAGVYEPWYFLTGIGRRLNEAGHPVHVVKKLGYNRTSITSAAEAVAAYVTELDLRNVVVLAHSKGGLVGKQLMTVPGAAERIDGLIAIATPFSGSSLAPYVPSRTIRALGPADALIVALAANLDLNSRITSIYGEFDPHIPGGSELAGATNICVPVVGHFRVLADKRVIQAALDAAAGASD